MRRRVYVSSLLAGTVGVAGCLESTSSDTSSNTAPSSATRPEEGAELTGSVHTATVDDGKRIRYTLSMSEPPADFDGDSPPTIEFEGDGTRITVSGGMLYGSSTCDEIAVQDLAMTVGPELRIVIGAATRGDAPRTCTADMAYALYDLVLETDGISPSKVTVVENPEGEDQQQWSATPPE
ncbi:hypothetical protein ACOZ4N_15245 [Halorientalis pallida]|uniref:hypothetical protein n=1 Tax=Halorientalis pallida TaxID=2479928 RepID=UPI003C6FBFA9